ncbi:unnamed protein product [Paramecium pentaurelia]|uniref:Uncharacterized protein n=1 Tax=Paramecium pentaurelia TaxID=43138 RepID=A0A8S1YLB0_9CILI|nr:unnamed protein product [Paramecium pentaurelia]
MELQSKIQNFFIQQPTLTNINLYKFFTIQTFEGFLISIWKNYGNEISQLLLYIFKEDVECDKYALYFQGLVHISQKMQFKLEKKIINNIQKVAVIQKNNQQREGPIV